MNSLSTAKKNKANSAENTNIIQLPRMVSDRDGQTTLDISCLTSPKNERILPNISLPF
jgi:hypothetical protein